MRLMASLLLWLMAVAAAVFTGMAALWSAEHPDLGWVALLCGLATLAFGGGAWAVSFGVLGRQIDQLHRRGGPPR